MAALSSLVVAPNEQPVPWTHHKSAGIQKKRNRTYAEMIGCYVLIEPMNIHSIAIQNQVSYVDSCETNQVQQLCGESGQQPNAVKDIRIELDGNRIKLDGNPIELNSNQIEFDGNRIELNGNRRELDDKQIELNGNRIELDAKMKGVGSLKRSDKDELETGLMFKCHICQMAFRLKDSLKLHIRTHIREKLYECQVCQMAFSQIYYLNWHIKSHAGEKTYECQACKKTFSQLRNLKCHVGRIHKGKKPYECQVCKMTFSQQIHFKNHSKDHAGQKTYECQVCKKTFTRLGNLKRHIGVIHTESKQYECQVCKKTFKHLGNLKYHTKIHTGEKPYECQVCKKTFSQKNSLKCHTKIHTGERPYECQVCKKTFVQKINLKNHTKIHTGEKSYECQVCKKTFSQFGSIKNNSSKMTTCPPCASIRCEVGIVNCSAEALLKSETKLEPDSVLAADLADHGIDCNHMPEDSRNEIPPMISRLIKEEIIDSEVDTTEFVTADEHYVFLDEKIEIKFEVDKAVEGSATDDFGVTVKQEMEYSDSCLQ